MKTHHALSILFIRRFLLLMHFLLDLSECILVRHLCRLHLFDLGLVSYCKDWLVASIKEHAPVKCKSKNVALFDARWNELPFFSSSRPVKYMKRFNNRVSSMSFLQGGDFFLIMQLLPIVFGTSHQTWNMPKNVFEDIQEVLVLQKEIGMDLKMKMKWSEFELNELDLRIQRYRTLLKKNFSSYSKSDFCFSKFHEPSHLSHYIRLFGPAMNTDNGMQENGHKFLAKVPYSRSSRQVGFEHQMILWTRRWRLMLSNPSWYAYIENTGGSDQQMEKVEKKKFELERNT